VSSRGKRSQGLRQPPTQAPLRTASEARLVPGRPCVRVCIPRVAAQVHAGARRSRAAVRANLSILGSAVCRSPADWIMGQGHVRRELGRGGPPFGVVPRCASAHRTTGGAALQLAPKVQSVQRKLNSGAFASSSKKVSASTWPLETRRGVLAAELARAGRFLPRDSCEKPVARSGSGLARRCGRAPAGGQGSTCA
jgi:hypothetical protein